MKPITNAFGTPTSTAVHQMLPYGQGQGTLKSDTQLLRLQFKPDINKTPRKKLDVSA
jgi:hypothetical protein